MVTTDKIGSIWVVERDGEKIYGYIVGRDNRPGNYRIFWFKHEGSGVWRLNLEKFGSINRDWFTLPNISRLL